MSTEEVAQHSSSVLNTPNHERNESDDEEEDDEIYEVEKILNHRLCRGKRHFLVRWKGYSASADSWEPKENLEGASEVLNNYLSSIKGGSKEKTRVGGKLRNIKRKRGSTRNSKSKLYQLRNAKDASQSSASQVKEGANHEENSSDEFAPPEKRKKTSKKEFSSSPSKKSKQSDCSSSTVAEITIEKEIARRAKMAKGLRWITESSDDSEAEMSTSSSTIKVDDDVADTSTNIVISKPDESNNLNADSVKTSPGAKVEEEKTAPSTLNNNGNHKEKSKEEKHSKSDKNSGRKGASNPKASSSSLPSKRSSLTFEGIYRHNDNQLRFVGVDEKTQKREIYTMGEAYVADAWNLVRYLSSKVKFKESGKPCIDGNST